MSIAILNIKSAQVTNEKVKTLYERYGKKLFAYTCKNYQINEDDSWSIVYKTIYQVAGLNDSYSFDCEQKLTAFIFKTHINFLKNFFRDDKTFENKNFETALHENSFISEESTPVSENPAVLILQNELDKMEEWQRILLLMRGQGMPYSEIARFVQKPEKQLKVYYARLKKDLHSRMNETLKNLNNKK